MKLLISILVLLTCIACKREAKTEIKSEPQIVYTVDSAVILSMQKEIDSLGQVIARYRDNVDSLELETGYAKCVLDVAGREVGIREDVGNNRGSRIEQYLKAVGLGGGYAYCAAFVCWVLEECKVDHPKSAWSPTTALYNPIYIRGKDEQLPELSEREVYVFGLWYNNLGRIGHTGFIEKEKDDKYYFTIEGNTNGQGSREGDGVHRKWRPKWSIYAISKY